jgi:carbon starvation protein CstA
MNPDEINLNSSGSTPTPQFTGTSPLANSYSTPKVSVLYSRFQPSNQLPAIIRVLLKTKVVKSEKQAEGLILGFIIVLIIVTAVIFTLSFQETPVNI